MPKGITGIANYTFSGCKNLKTINLQADVVSIGDYAFYLCTNLENINVLIGLKNVGKAAFVGSQMQNINIISGEIQEKAFWACSKLETVNMAEGVTNIGYAAFYQCTALETINISKTVTTISDYAFSYAGNIQNLNIPIGITNIGEGAFSYSRIQNVEIEAKGEIKQGAFYKCTQLKSANILGGITKIGNEAFYKCTTLENVHIQKSLETLEDKVFMNCYNLQNLNLPEGLLTIGSNAFCCCENLTNLVIPKSVISIKESAFADATTHVKIQAETISIEKYPDIMKRIFDENDILTCNKNFDISNASFNSDYSQLTVNENAENITIYIESGKLNGLTIVGIVERQEEKVAIVEFGTNGNEAWSQTQSTTVSLTELETELDKQSLKYLWTEISSEPTIDSFDLQYQTSIYKGKFSNGETLSINTENMIWYLWVSVQDLNGNRLVKGSKPFYLDNTAPKITEVMGNPTDWIDADVILEINATDEESGLNTEAYSFDNGIIWQPTNIKTYSENINGIKIQVKDACGNISEYTTIDITKIRRPESIKVTTLPNKIEYKAHEQLDTTGMIVTVTYDNGDKEETTNYTIVNGEDLTCQAQHIELQYNKNAEITANIDVKVGHDIKEAICTEEVQCRIEGCNYKEPAVNHSFTNYISDNNASCIKDGTKTAKCDRCETTHIITDEGTKIAHTEVIDQGKAATCIETGLTEGKHCSVCNTVIATQKEILALGHQYEKKVIAPTCVEQGYTTYKCTICEHEYIGTYVDELGHSFTNYISDNNATCTEDGTLTAQCDKCEERYTITDRGSKKSHNYKDGKCIECNIGEPKPEITSSKYNVQELYISKVQAKTTVKYFKDQIQTNSAEITIYNKNNQIQEETAIISTGMRVEVKLGNQIKDFKVVVQGDVTGNGEVEFIDLIKINQHILNKRLLTEEEVLAGDVTGDGKVTFIDLIKINSFRLNKISEL